MQAAEEVSEALRRNVEARDHGAEARNKKAIQASFQAWRDGTGRVFDLLAPNAKWTAVGNSPIEGTYHSRQQFLDEVIDPFNARLASRLIPTVRGIYADGDMVVALFDGEGGLPSTASPIETHIPGSCACTTGKFTRWWGLSIPSRTRISGPGSSPLSSSIPRTYSRNRPEPSCSTVRARELRMHIAPAPSYHA